MREINLNGYIDDEVWFGDEITPDSLHEMLYEPGADQRQSTFDSEDVHIRLNSYGGSCNAAVRMHDDLVAYPGKISITISGTAASAATVLAMAADTLEMTPGSLFMIHDPIVGAIGNEADLMEAIGLLRACKDSIINVYATRTLAGRDQIAQMMKETTWMDAEAALAYGFIDRIAAPSAFGTVINCAVAREVAEKKVQLWVDRHKQLVSDIRKKEQTVNPEEDQVDDHEAERLPQEAAIRRIAGFAQNGQNCFLRFKESEKAPSEAGVPASAEDAPAAPPEEAPAPEPSDEPVEAGEAEAPEDAPGADHPDEHDTGTPVSQLRKRLALIMPSEARK